MTVQIDIQDGLNHGNVMYEQGQDQILRLLDIASWKEGKEIEDFVKKFIKENKEK